ncbi:hypothetical protein ACIF4Y_22530 [Kosakonia cowanii]|uniref:hypothetical protein n=1 Tax=Kosakonia cowanii TaxID=208223 RepID=UPI0037CB36FB
MMNQKIRLQRLRVPTGWTIGINNFYEVEPVDDFIEYYYGSVLIGGDNKIMGLSFDSRYEPEGEPNGEFIFVSQKNEYDKKGNLIGVSVLDVKRTRKKSEFIDMVEWYMEKGVL